MKYNTYCKNCKHIKMEVLDEVCRLFPYTIDSVVTGIKKRHKECRLVNNGNCPRYEEASFLRKLWTKISGLLF